MGSSIEVRGRNDAGECSLRFLLFGGFGVGWEREGEVDEEGQMRTTTGDLRTTRGRMRTTTGRLDGETGSGEGKMRKGDEKGS